MSRSLRTIIQPSSLLLVQLLLAGSAWAQPASGHGFDLSPGITLDAREEAYDVSGNSVAELRSSLLESAPEEVRPFFGRHVWTVEWSFRYVQQDGSCEVLDADVHVKSKTTVPRWNPGPSPPAPLIHRWNRFMRALQDHERGHLVIAVEAAEAVRTTLQEVRVPDCASISAKANAAAEKTLDSFVQKDRQYDVDTRHGKSQGATWPP